MGASARATTPPRPGAVEDRNPSKLGPLRSGPRSGAAPVARSVALSRSYPVVGQGFAWSPLLKLFHRVNGVLFGPRIERRQRDGSVLRGRAAAEVVDRAWDEVASLLPGTCALVGARRVKRIELRPRGRVRAADAGETTRADPILDPGQVGLEGDRREVAPSARRRAGEDHRLRMGPLVDPWIRIRPRPVLLVGRPVEVDVGTKAAVDVYDPGVPA